MADTTSLKRVLPARERRESATKRRASSPVQSETTVLQGGSAELPTEPRQKRKYTKRSSLVKTHSESPAAPATRTDDGIPGRLSQSEPLPTATQPQSDRLSLEEYQSVADSAVLAASLHRSRMRWLCDGIFEKYWTKPSRRKGVSEAPPNNPDLKSMQRLGNATVIVEPHTFDVTFYSVKDPSSIPPVYHRHPNQHTAKHSQPPPPATPVPSVRLVAPVPPALPAPPAPPPPSTVTPRSVVPPTPTPSASANIAPKHDPPNSPLPPQASSSKTGKPPSVPSMINRPPTPPGGAKTTDPVIQMLAARAASDSRLKDLMKVVATSRASPEQLREFQAHIDEFNAIVKRQEAEREKQAQQAQQAAAKTVVPSRPQESTQTQNTTNVPKTPATTHQPTPHRGTSSAQPTASTPATGVQAPPPPPPPRPEPVIKHIVMEFASNASYTQAASPDRWLFPPQAVLEMRLGGLEMICSFFVERRGSDLLAAVGGPTGPDEVVVQKWKPDTTYYESVSMVVKATQHRTIETIARSAKSLIEVQNYMRETMEKKTRAPREYLVYRLPRDSPQPGDIRADFVDSAIELSEDEDDELRDYYGV